jgi:probable rRNA maturation factor
MIFIKNTQRSVPVLCDLVLADAERLLLYLQLGEYDLSIWITTDKTIRRFNRDFRSKDKPTDILSFGGLAYAMTDDAQESPVLGDLVISAPFVQRMLPELGCTMEERMRVLLVHGVTHLLGFDHETDEDWEKMQEKEAELLAVLQQI